MSYECRCNTIELPWEDSNCPFHGTEAQRKEKDEEQNRSNTVQRFVELEEQLETLNRKVAALIEQNERLNKLTAEFIANRVAKP